MILSADPPPRAGFGVTGTVDAANIGRALCDGRFRRALPSRAACPARAVVALPAFAGLRSSPATSAGWGDQPQAPPLHRTWAAGPTAIYPGGLLPPLLTAIRAGLLRTLPGSASMVTLAGAIGKCHFALAGAGS